jgi:hypothetical protein
MGYHWKKCKELDRWKKKWVSWETNRNRDIKGKPWDIMREL